MPSFFEIGPPVPEKKILEGFLSYMGMAAILVKKKIFEGVLTYMGMAAILVM